MLNLPFVIECFSFFSFYFLSTVKLPYHTNIIRSIQYYSNAPRNINVTGCFSFFIYFLLIVFLLLSLIRLYHSCLCKCVVFFLVSVYDCHRITHSNHHHQTLISHSHIHVKSCPLSLIYEISLSLYSPPMRVNFHYIARNCQFTKSSLREDLIRVRYIFSHLLFFFHQSNDCKII